MALKRRRVQKSKPGENQGYAKRILLVDLECKNGCGNIEIVSSDTKAVTCAYCVQKMLDPSILPQTKNKDEVAKPAGWHFMNHFVDSTGVVYSKGKLVEGAKKEKPTKIKKKKSVKSKGVKK